MKKFLFALILTFCSAMCFGEALLDWGRAVEKDRGRNAIPLSCKWDFYWNRFIDPSSPWEEGDMKVDIPSSWNRYTLGDSKERISKMGRGSASYRLRIFNMKPNTDYSFTTYRLGYTAFEIYVNGKLIHQAGEPNVDYKKTKVQQYFDLVTFKSDSKGEAVFVVHISNDMYRKGGFREAIKMQESVPFVESYNRELIYYSILCSILSIIIIYSLMLFILKKDKVNLFLAVFVFSIMARVMFSIFPLIKYFIPGIPFHVMLRFEYLSVFFAPAAFTLYIDAMDRKIFNRIKAFYLAIPSFVFLLLNMVLPIAILNRLVTSMQVYLFFIILTDMVFLLKRIFKDRSVVSRNLSFSLIIIAIGALNDLLITNDIYIVSVPLLAPSFVLFAIAQTGLIAYLENRNLTRVEELNASLTESNQAYYRFVPRELLKLLGKNDIRELKGDEWMHEEMAIMSCDIRNFTSISEKLNEMQVFEMLNTYLKKVAPIIRKNGGMIEKYMGDGIIAIFPESAESALNCAIQMQEVMPSLREQFAQKNFPLIKIGIGVHYGEAIIGIGGDEHRRNEISLSKDIDVAMKTEAATKTYQMPILVTKKAMKAAAFEVKSRGGKFQFYGRELNEKVENEEIFCIYTQKTGLKL